MADINEPLLPVVQMKLGTDDFLVSLPPQHLQEFILTSNNLGADHFSMVFVDPEFGKLERMIFESDRESRPLLFRWGYPGNGLEKAMWHKAYIREYLPTISHTGVRMSINGLAEGSEFALLVEPKSYYGRISTVVRSIAEEMGFTGKNTYIEETDDEENEVRKTEWYTANRTRIDILHDLRSIARSKQNPNAVYVFKLGSSGTFHFHTDRYEGLNYTNFGKSKEPAYRKFNVLYGNPTGVVRFTPRYQAKSIGALANQVVAGTMDPRSKQFQQRVLSRQSLGLSSKDEPKNAKVTQAPLTKSTDHSEQLRKANAYVFQPAMQPALGGRCAGRTTTTYTSPEQALVKAENHYKELQKLVGGGTLELVGLIEHSSFIADEQFCEISVVMPQTIGNDDSQISLHWSSGRYYIYSIEHRIISNYLITVELGRPYHFEGTDTAKTGPPSKPVASETRVT